MLGSSKRKGKTKVRQILEREGASVEGKKNEEEEERRKEILVAKKTCRFCLAQHPTAHM